MNIQQVLKATFEELVRRNILWGVKPIFNGIVDLEVDDPVMKTLMLTYLQFDREVYPYPFKIPCPCNEEITDYKHPVHIPFIFRTFMDHWDENKEILRGKMWVKFINIEVYSENPSYIQRKRRQIIDKCKKELSKNGYDPSRVLLVRYEGKIEEKIGEFISLLYFRNLGYITTLYTPSSGVGVPDVTCWRTPVLKKLQEYNFVNGGAMLWELQTLRIFGKICSNKDDNFSGEAIVIEVESSSSPHSGISQLLGTKGGSVKPKEGYVCGGYDKGFLVAPCFRREYEDIGILSFDEEGIFFHDCPKDYSQYYGERKKRNVEEMNTLFKWILLANFTLDELSELVQPTPKTAFRFLRELNRIDIDIILDKLKDIRQR